MESTCAVLNCQKETARRGWCHSHYRRWLHHGDPLAGRSSNGAAEQFLRDVVIPYKGSGCLIWPFRKTENGYGLLWQSGRHKIVSRIVCEEVHGPPPTPEHEAAHSCGKGHEACVAPDHVTWKTHTENVADTLVHGTRNRGERHGMAKLTEADIHEIRSMRGQFSRHEIAAKFGVADATVLNIDAERTWSWLPYRKDMQDAGRGHLLR